MFLVATGAGMLRAGAILHAAVRRAAPIHRSGRPPVQLRDQRMKAVDGKPQILQIHPDILPDARVRRGSQNVRSSAREGRVATDVPLSSPALPAGRRHRVSPRIRRKARARTALLATTYGK